MVKYFAPGRVNLIGEHLDYNGGLVLPVAINQGITLSFTPRNDLKVILTSSAHSDVHEFSLEEPVLFHQSNKWVNYVLGVIDLLAKEGVSLNGGEFLFDSTLPEGVGLSSSAALEVVTGFTVMSELNQSINKVWLANLCKTAENEFVKMNCGIMDQYAVALGKADNAVLIDCSIPSHSYVPFELQNYKLVIMDTDKKRGLVDSEYNLRREQSYEGLRILQTSNPGVQHLTQAEMHWIQLISDEVIRKRVRHVISEQLRVIEAVHVLENNDLSTFGRLMNASHKSLKEDFEVSCVELDVIVELAQKAKGCLGARMTGGGFGGCAIALVNAKLLEQFIETVSKEYESRTSLSCKMIVAEAGDGVRRLV